MAWLMHPVTWHNGYQHLTLISKYRIHIVNPRKIITVGCYCVDGGIESADLSYMMLSIQSGDFTLQMLLTYCQMSSQSPSQKSSQKSKESSQEAWLESWENKYCCTWALQSNLLLIFLLLWALLLRLLIWLLHDCYMTSTLHDSYSATWLLYVCILKVITDRRTDRQTLANLMSALQTKK